MNPFLEWFFGDRLKQQTRQHLESVSKQHSEAYRDKVTHALHNLAAAPAPKVLLGHTRWGQSVSIPLDMLLGSHSLTAGSTGSGKTMQFMIVIEQLLAADVGFAAISGAKPDLYWRTLYLIMKELERRSPDSKAASALRRRVRPYDYDSYHAISSHNLLARGRMKRDFFAGSRLDLLVDVLPDARSLDLARPFLKSLLEIFSEPYLGLSIRELIRALEDERLLARVLERCRDRELVAQMQRQRATLSPSTLAAVRRRLEVLVSSENVRLALAGPSAPDFVQMMDEGAIILPNFSGPEIFESVAAFLQALFVTDLCRSIYARRDSSRFYIIVDEAQNLFALPRVREHLLEAVRLAREYNVAFAFGTQNLAAAVADTRVLRQLHTNVGWTFSMHTEPQDCEFVKPFLPVTGRVRKPAANPYSEPQFYTPAEERSLVWEQINQLPKQVGWLFLQSVLPEAVRVRTRNLVIPERKQLEEVTRALRRDPTIGGRLSRREFDRLIAERDLAWNESEAQSTDVNAALEQGYRRTGPRAKEPGGGQ